MIVLSLFYPNEPGGRFDEEYYLNRHIPLVRERWGPMGLTDIRLLRGIGTPDGASAWYRVVALVSFDSSEELSQALAAHREEIFASIRRYTDIEPVVQISEELA
jgi:uncharacterized protein (TIGR02118 family)